MAKEELVSITSQNQPVQFLQSEASLLKPHQPARPKELVVLECPRCCWIFRVEKPDSQHPNCAFNKPDQIKTKGNLVEEPRVCRNPKCKKHFTLYWYKQAKQKSS